MRRLDDSTQGRQIVGEGTAGVRLPDGRQIAVQPRQSGAEPIGHEQGAIRVCRDAEGALTQIHLPKRGQGLVQDMQASGIGGDDMDPPAFRIIGDGGRGIGDPHLRRDLPVTQIHHRQRIAVLRGHESKIPGHDRGCKQRQQQRGLHSTMPNRSASASSPAL